LLFSRVLGQAHFQKVVRNATCALVVWLGSHGGNRPAQDFADTWALAEPGEPIAKSPLQRTLTVHIMGHWAKHEGALAHISLKRSIEMLELQCTQCFPARPADPDSSVFAELFPAPQPEPSQPDVPTEKAKQMHLNWNPLGFLLDLSTNKFETCFPPDVSQAFFCRSFRAPIPKMLAHAHSRTLCSCKMCIDPLGDHVLTCKQHTGSIRSHNHLMDVVASLSRDSKIGPVRVNHKVSTTGDGTRKQSDVEISNFPISLRDGFVIEVSFVCEFKVAVVHLGGGITVCAILMTSYRPVPRSRTTSTRTLRSYY